MCVKKKKKSTQVCGSSVFECASVSIVLAYVHQFKGNKVCVYVCMHVCAHVCVCVCVWLRRTCTGHGLDLLHLHQRNRESSRTHLCQRLHPHGGPVPRQIRAFSVQNYQQIHTGTQIFLHCLPAFR